MVTDFEVMANNWVIADGTGSSSVLLEATIEGLAGTIFASTLRFSVRNLLKSWILDP